jgi:hypothetical protein
VIVPPASSSVRARMLPPQRSQTNLRNRPLERATGQTAGHFAGQTADFSWSSLLPQRILTASQPYGCAPSFCMTAGKRGESDDNDRA